jgi:hypothetical protein
MFSLSGFISTLVAIGVLIILVVIGGRESLVEREVQRAKDKAIRDINTFS